MLTIIAQAHAQEPIAEQAMSNGGLFQIVLLLGLFVLFYFIAIRPQRKRQKEHASLIARLSKGDEVVTNSGILGKITQLDDDYLILRVADKVDMRFQKASIHAVLPKGTLKPLTKSNG